MRTHGGLTANAFWKLKILRAKSQISQHLAYPKLTNPARKPSKNSSFQKRRATRHITHIPEISVQHLHVSVNYLQRDKFIVRLANARYKEQGRIAPIYDLRVYPKRLPSISS
jgi:hypothetical protein